MLPIIVEGGPQMKEFDGGLNILRKILVVLTPLANGLGSLDVSFCCFHVAYLLGLRFDSTHTSA